MTPQVYLSSMKGEVAGADSIKAVYSVQCVVAAG